MQLIAVFFIVSFWCSADGFEVTTEEMITDDESWVTSITNKDVDFHTEAVDSESTGPTYSTTAPPVDKISVTMSTVGCTVAFIALRGKDNTFRGSCADSSFPFTENSPSLMPDPVNDDCAFFYLMDYSRVWRCPCAPGSRFDTVAKTCVQELVANCSCPEGSRPIPGRVTTTTTTKSSNKDEGDDTGEQSAINNQEKQDNEVNPVDESSVNSTHLAVGLVVAIAAAIFVVLLVLFLRKRRHHEKCTSCETHNPNYGQRYRDSEIYNILDEKSMTWSSISSVAPPVSERPHPDYDNHVNQTGAMQDDTGIENQYDNHKPPMTDGEIALDDTDTENQYDNHKPSTEDGDTKEESLHSVEGKQNGEQSTRLDEDAHLNEENHYEVQRKDDDNITGYENQGYLQ